MIEREGKLIAKVIPGAKGETLTPEIIKTVKQSASVITDEWLGYNSLKRVYDHSFAKHNEGEYVNGKIYTNTIEGFLSLLKRGIIGIRHFTTCEHLQKYVDEFAFRYNPRERAQQMRVKTLFRNMENRMTYKELIYG
jgi:hypothetical protein